MRTPTVEIREATDQDLDAVTDIVNRANPWDAPTTSEVVSWALSRLDSNRPHAYLVAEAQGRVVGAAFVRYAPYLQPLAFDIDVDPANQRTGIGTRLFRRVIDVVRGEPRLVMLVSESSEGGLAFAAKNGFIERSRMFESQLSLADFDPQSFAPSAEWQRETGIRFSTVAREDSPALRRALHRLAEKVSEDIPTPEPIPPVGYEQWEADWIEGPLATPDLFVVAFSGERPVAFTQIFTTPDGTAYHRLTGVAPDHRGKGLGLAVKAEALGMAKDRGIPRVRTENDTPNTHMLAINDKLGFKRLPGIIRLDLELNPAKPT
jgi:GNAT superfamily N-acetyltransferase